MVESRSPKPLVACSSRVSPANIQTSFFGFGYIFAKTFGEALKHVEIYTDGACSGNPGMGGWCAILMYGGNEKTLSGGEKETTNNRMEVYAAIAGLSALKQSCSVTLYSDSAYLVNSVERGWLSAWRANGWRTADGKSVKNRELWEDLFELLSVHEVTFAKVKGHADNEYNNRCDKAARAEIAKLKQLK